MLEELFSKAESSLQDNLPFVLYSKPSDVLVHGIYQKDDQLHVTKEFTETGFVFAPFNLKEDIVLIPTDELFAAPFNDVSISNQKQFTQIFSNEETREDYQVLIEKAISEIEQGAFNKVVLSRKVEVAHSLVIIDIFKKVLHTYSNAFCYLWYHPKVGTWIGATPEILIKSNGQEFTTMSLAGTQNALEFAEPNWTSKEINEQQVVTDYILEALQDVSKTVIPSEVESIRAGNLWHLRTKLKGRFALHDFSRLIKAIHPTPAVCGVPLKATQDFIVANENYNRSFYTGFLGELNFKKEIGRNKNRKNQENSAYKSIQNQSELFVNLRCMQVFEQLAHVYVGGGITAASQPDKEWEETVSKSKTMLKVLGY